MTSPQDILYNRTDEGLGWPSAPMDLEDFQNFLTDKKKQTQKEHYDQGHRTEDWQSLQPRQAIYSLSLEEPSDSYIPGTIISTTPPPHSYIVKHQGCQHHHTRHHICAIKFSECSPITRQSQP